MACNFIKTVRHNHIDGKEIPRREHFCYSASIIVMMVRFVVSTKSG